MCEIDSLTKVNALTVNSAAVPAPSHPTDTYTGHMVYNNTFIHQSLTVNASEESRPRLLPLKQPVGLMPHLLRFSSTPPLPHSIPCLLFSYPYRPISISSSLCTHFIHPLTIISL